MYRNSLIHRLFGTASDSRTDSAPSERGSDEVDKSNVEAIRDAMLLTVMPCSELHRLHATHQIQHAKSVTELWLIRADIFQYLAQDLDQTAAAEQITALMPLFKGRVAAAAMPALHTS